MTLGHLYIISVLFLCLLCDLLGTGWRSPRYLSVLPLSFQVVTRDWLVLLYKGKVTDSTSSSSLFLLPTEGHDRECCCHMWPVALLMFSFCLVCYLQSGSL